MVENNPVNMAQLLPVLEFHTLSDVEIATVLRDFKSTSSAGLDGLSARLIKSAGPSLVPVVRHLINLSITQSKFPECWKVGSITPLFKEGDRTDPSNYRPISILPTMGKICERVVHTQLYDYCTQHNVISESQSGFRKEYSTCTCLIDFLANILQNVDNGRACEVLFLDLRKAFDTVNHQVLLSKLRQYGMRPTSVGHKVGGIVSWGTPAGH